jgi:hypothetical protein
VSARLGKRRPKIIDRLNREINAGLADSKIKARFADLGATVGRAAEELVNHGGIVASDV